MPGSGFGMAAGGRLFADWSGFNTTIDSRLTAELCLMRQRSRAFALNEDYARAYLIAARNNIIGPSGVTLQMDVTDPPKPMKQDDGTEEWIAEPDTLVNDAIEAAYKEFSKARVIDAHGRERPSFCVSGDLTRTEFADLGITAAERDGEFLCRLVRGFDNPWRFAVEPMNADYLDETKNMVLEDGGSIRLGVQRNRWGEVTHYWLRKWIPGDTYWPNRNSDPYRSEPVDASNIIHFFFREDVSQSRGIPSLHAGAQRLKMLSGYEEAALEASRAAACKHEYFKRMNDPNAPAGEYQGDGEQDGVPLSDVEPGTREELPPGFDVVAIDPKYPHSEHGGFITTTLGGVSAGLGISRMTLTGDLTQANYSSMRAGLLPERDFWMKKQGHWINRVELVIFLVWLRMALMNGAIMLPNGSKLPAARFEKFARPIFQGRRWQWIDPATDQEANSTALAQRIQSRGAILAQQGHGDPDEMARTIKRERKIYARNGIVLPEDVETTSALMLAKKPAAPAAEPAASEVKTKAE